MQDGTGTQLADYASYAVHHLQRNAKNLEKENVQIFFADMTPEQVSTSFIDSLGQGEERRKQLDDELKFSALLDSAGWLANNLRYGCAKCAPYLTR